MKKWIHKMRQDIMDFFKEHHNLYIIFRIFTFPFWLVYKIILFLIHFSSLILNILIILLLCAAIFFGVAYARIMPIYEEAAETAYDKLANMNENSFHMLSNTIVYDKNNKKIGEIDSGSYRYVKINRISPYIQYGYIATEDKRFMQHGGVDLQSITRAALSLITKKEITQGGSTITQQVIKNNMLTQEQTFSRKLTEVLLAPTLEKKYSKADIMEFYCNSNYYGNRCYGVETACRFYFGCSANEVSLAQAAMLCGISNSPNNYNPIASMKYATQKKLQVLDNMLSEGYITKKEYRRAKKEEITIVGVDTTSTSENYMLSYAIDCAAQQLMAKDGFVFQYKFDTKKEEDEYKEKYMSSYGQKSAEIRAGGYKLYTSFDQKLQAKLQKSVSGTLSAFTEKNKKTKKYALQGAAMCIDNQTQYVVAVVGGRSKSDQYNRAFLSSRQPGSTIKPLLDYGPAIDNGIINGSSTMRDSKVYWDSSDKKSYSPANSGGGYSNRSMTMREGLSRSKNTIAFQVFKKLGIDSSLSYLEKLRFTSLSYADNTAPAISLGGFTNGVTINNMCRGYATIANNGKLSSRTCIKKIEHDTTGVVYMAPELEESETEVFSADTSFILKDMLQGPIADSYGTAHSAYNDNQIYAGKTGTTNSNKDAWFCGFSAYYTTSVWIGYDTPRVMSGMYGGTYPLRIWSSFMNQIHKKLPKQNFEIPHTIELRRVSGGKFSSSKKNIHYSDNKRYYSQRPGGYDYYSQLNLARKSKWQKDFALEHAKKEAESVVSVFESYKIKSAKDAMNFEKEYNKVLAVIDEIPDEYEQTPYKERAATKFNSLNKEVITKWQKAIEEYKQQQIEEKQQQQKIDAEDAKNKAKDTLKKNRIKKIQWYINAINKRSYYSKVTKLLIKDGKKALERIEGYSEYEAMKAAYNSAVARAKKLPKVPENPVIPENPSDKRPVNPDNYPGDATPVPATPEPVE